MDLYEMLFGSHNQDRKAWVTIDGKPVLIGGPSSGGGGSTGGGAGNYRPYETAEEKELYDYATTLIPARLMEDAGVVRIVATAHPESSHAETLGRVEDGVVYVNPGDRKTLIHEIAHRIDYSPVGEEMLNRGIHEALRDHPRMGNIGYRERAAVFIEGIHSPKGSRANDWVNDAFPDLVRTYQDILKERGY